MSQKRHRRARGARRAAGAEAPMPGLPSPSALPAWEGVHSWRTVCEDVARACASDHDAEIRGTAVGAGVTAVSVMALDALRIARPIHIGAAQLAALPAFDTVDDALMYARELRLPFDPVYLDFTDRGGPAWVTVDGRQLALYGALLGRGPIDHPDATVPFGKLSIVPFGMAVRAGEATSVPADGRGEEHPPAAPLGSVAVDVEHDVADLAITGCGDIGESEPSLYAAVASLPSAQVYDIVQPGTRAGAVPCRILTGSGALVAEAVRAADEATPGWLRAPLAPLGAPLAAGFFIEAHRVCELAMRALAALFLIDSANVEIVDAPVSRQVRRAVERAADARRQIAMTVAIRTRRPDSRPTPARDGKPFPYSHAFERGPTYRHVKRGSHVRCSACRGEQPDCTRCDGTGLDPEQVTPCPRHGLCRREYVPTTIVGAGTGLPLVLKARVLRADRDPDVIDRTRAAMSARHAAPVDAEDTAPAVDAPRRDAQAA